MIRLIVILLGVLVGTTACVSPIVYATRAPRPLTYVGTITFGQPEVRGRMVVVPLRYSGGEWIMNSGIVPYGTKAEVSANGAIEFTVITSLSPGNPAHAFELRLPKPKAGTYDMIYVDPDGTKHSVGKIAMP